MSIFNDLQEVRNFEKLLREAADAAKKVAEIMEQNPTEDEVDFAMKDFVLCMLKMQKKC